MLQQHYVSLNGSVDSITITNTGSGYLSAPEVLVSGGSGINAKFNALLKIKEYLQLI